MDVLVVEDDPRVREVITENLAGSGWEVAEAASAEAAVGSISAQEGEPPCPVLVTDVDLGHDGLDGIALATMFRCRWPALGVVIITGQAQNLACCGAFGPHARHLRKPSLPRQLLDAVQEPAALAAASVR